MHGIKVLAIILLALAGLLFIGAAIILNRPRSNILFVTGAMMLVGAAAVSITP